jgi:hypothetical protein
MYIFCEVGTEFLIITSIPIKFVFQNHEGTAVSRNGRYRFTIIIRAVYSQGMRKEGPAFAVRAAHFARIYRSVPSSDRGGGVPSGKNPRVLKHVSTW